MNQTRNVDMKEICKSGVYAGDAVMTSRNVVESAFMSEPSGRLPRSTKDAAGSETRLAWLDVLRGLAALAVVFGHLSYVVLQPARWVIYQLFNPGDYRVVALFIISGYSVPAS